MRNREYYHSYRYDDGRADRYSSGDSSRGVDPLIWLLGVVVIVIFLLGLHAGKSGEHTRQRRLAKVRSRINSLDPADVTDYRLSTIEDVLPAEKK